MSKISDRIAELRASANEAVGKAKELIDKALAEDRGLTEDESAEVEGYHTAANEQRADVAKLERQERLEAEGRASTGAPPVDLPKPKEGADLDLTDGEAKGYSLFRALRAMSKGNWRGAEFEGECSDEIAKRTGKDPRGFYMPMRALLKQAELREIGKVSGEGGANTTGAALVGTDHLSQEFIEFLRPNSVVVQAGARVLAGLVGDVDIPRQSAAAAPAWLATEGADSADSTLTTDSVTLTPKTIGVHSKITRRMIQQSSPAVEALVNDDLRAGIALAVDLGALSGSGASGQPQGIIGATDVGSSDTGVGVTWAEIVAFETDVNSNNALQGALSWVTTPSIMGMLKSTVKESGQATYLLQDNMMNGYAVRTSSQLDALHLIFGNWNEVLIGEWGILDIFPDPYTDGDSGGMRIRAFKDVDVALRHGESFTLSTDTA